MNESHATPPPHVQLIMMAAGSWVAAIVCTAARLGVADRLAVAPKSADELAGPLEAHAPTLARLLRSLAGLGVVTERDDGRFALTPLGDAMRSDAPGAARSTLMTFGDPAFWRSWEEMAYSVKTGKPAFDRVWGMPIFDYFAEHPELARLFSETMVGFHGQEPPEVAAAYDFSTRPTVVDVGGATGNMLAAIVERHAGVRGVLFDRPHVVGDALALLASHGVTDRVSIVPGDFFRSVPEGGDAYVLSHIIHDWTEEQCLTILGNVKKAMKPGAVLLLVETVLPEGDVPHQGKLQDMVMLVLPGGQERTEAEYARLLAKAGFKLVRVVPTKSVVSIVEAVVA